MTHVCKRIDDARDLRLALLEELRQVVPFDAFAWLLTDPGTQVGSSPIADVPCVPELPRLIRLKYATTTNRWTHQTRPVERLHAVTRGRLDESLVWRELLVDHHVTDVASVVFRDHLGCWAFLDLWRVGGIFTDDEADILAEHADVITVALRRCVLRTFAPPSEPRRETVEPIVLLMSDRLDVLAQTPATEAYLHALIPPEDGRPPIPAAAYNVAAQLLAKESGIDDHPPATRIHLTGDDWLKLRAARIGDDLAVTIERASASERLDLYGRSAGLTPREMELLSVLATGADTRTAAGRLFVSEHTIQDHLKAIFAKTGVSSRRELLARARGS